VIGKGVCCPFFSCRNTTMPRATPPIVLTTLLSLSLLSPDASAQRRRASRPPTPPPVPPACIDFYQDTHKDWLAAHPSTYGMDTVSALGELQEHVREQQYELLNNLMAHPATDAQRELGRLWYKGFDVETMAAEGLAPIEPLLTRINAISRPRDIAPMLTRLHFFGLGAGFSFHAGPDPEGSGLLLGTFSEAALGLPDPDYYLREDEDSRLLLAHYTLYVQEILRLTGTPEADLNEQMTTVLNLETRLARLVRPLPATPAAAPDAPPPDAETEDTPPTEPVRAKAAELTKQYRNLQLQEFFERHGIAQDAEIIITNPALLPGLNRLVGGIKPAQWKIYLRYHLAHTLAPYLPRDFARADFAFYGKILRGESAPPVPPQRILNAVNRMMGPVLARVYVARDLDTETRTAATQIASNIRTALQRSVDGNTWMSQSAKAEALAKLNALSIEIAAPEGLDEDDTLPDFSFGSFAHLYVESSRWRMAQEMRRIGRTDDSARRWDVLPQEPVLAYDLARNRLIVSAAALRPPIFDHRAGRAAQYGSYGALVGREISRAIDHHGRDIDASGQQRTWWSDADTRAWDAKLTQLAAQYNRYVWPNTPAARVNGARTAGENSADLAGIELAWSALQTEQPELDNSARELFFRAWARLWREQTGPETAAYNALTQPYAPGRWRSNGPLVNHPAFAQTYQCPDGSAMTRADEERVALWR